MRNLLRKRFFNWKLKTLCIRHGKEKETKNFNKKKCSFENEEISYSKEFVNNKINCSKENENKTINSCYYDYSSISSLNNRHLDYEKLKDPRKFQKEKFQVRHF
jgi:hypothetical protein